VLHKHSGDCELRAKKAGWGSSWWIPGDEQEWRDTIGRKVRHGHTMFFIARCVFDKNCKARALVQSLKVSDALDSMGLFR